MECGVDRGVVMMVEVVLCELIVIMGRFFLMCLVSLGWSVLIVVFGFMRGGRMLWGMFRCLVSVVFYLVFWILSRLVVEVFVCLVIVDFVSRKVIRLGISSVVLVLVRCLLM